MSSTGWPMECRLMRSGARFRSSSRRIEARTPGPAGPHGGGRARTDPALFVPLEHLERISQADVAGLDVESSGTPGSQILIRLAIAPVVLASPVRSAVESVRAAEHLDRYVFCQDDDLSLAFGGFLHRYISSVVESLYRHHNARSLEKVCAAAPCADIQAVA